MGLSGHAIVVTVVSFRCMTLLLEGCLVAVQNNVHPFREVVGAQGSLNLAIFPNANFFAHFLNEGLL